MLQVESDWWLALPGQAWTPDLNPITNTIADDALTKDVDSYCDCFDGFNF